MSDEDRIVNIIVNKHSVVYFLVSVIVTVVVVAAVVTPPMVDFFCYCC